MFFLLVSNYIPLPPPKLKEKKARADFICIPYRFTETIDLNTTDAVVHKHTPYIVILVKIAEEWANTHGGNLPSTREEKRQFKVRNTFYMLLKFHP